jgi:hypothetical protein
MPLLSTSMPRLHPLLLLCSVAALALAYVMLIANRPSPPDWKKEQDRECTTAGLECWMRKRAAWAQTALVKTVLDIPVCKTGRW